MVKNAERGEVVQIPGAGKRRHSRNSPGRLGTPGCRGFGGRAADLSIGADHEPLPVSPHELPSSLHPLTCVSLHYKPLLIAAASSLP